VRANGSRLVDISIYLQPALLPGAQAAFIGSIRPQALVLAAFAP